MRENAFPVKVGQRFMPHGTPIMPHGSPPHRRILHGENRVGRCLTPLTEKAWTDLARLDQPPRAGWFDRPSSNDFSCPACLDQPSSKDFSLAGWLDRPSSSDLSRPGWLHRPSSSDFVRPGWLDRPSSSDLSRPATRWLARSGCQCTSQAFSIALAGSICLETKTPTLSFSTFLPRVAWHACLHRFLMARL